jgi:tetratricopeptide (TPR) repeat protein
MIPRPIVVFMLVALEGAAFAGPSAEELFHQGETFFKKGDYASAVAKWNESYRVSKEPELLFMIGQAFENDGRCAEALATYRRFVSLAPDSEHRPLADKFVRELTPKCDAAKAAPRENQSWTKTPDARQDRDLVEHDNETHPAGLKIAGLAVVGAGAVSVAAGLYFGHRASSLGEEVTNACRNGCDWAVYGAKDAQGRSAETKHYVFAGIGAAAIIGGGVMYWLASRAYRPPPIAVVPGRDGAVITWNGSW